MIQAGFGSVGRRTAAVWHNGPVLGQLNDLHVQKAQELLQEVAGCFGDVDLGIVLYEEVASYQSSRLFVKARPWPLCESTPVLACKHEMNGPTAA